MHGKEIAEKRREDNFWIQEENRGYLRRKASALSAQKKTAIGLKISVIVAM